MKKTKQLPLRELSGGLVLTPPYGSSLRLATPAGSADLPIVEHQASEFRSLGGGGGTGKADLESLI
jgi:hypothetical protein